MGYFDLVYALSSLSVFVSLQVGSVNIYNGISVKDLAAALGKDVDHVFECLFDIPTTKNVSSENSKLTRQVAEQVCKKSGVKAKIIAEPKIEKEIAGLLDASLS